MEALVITDATGNLLRADVDALVNTVNTVGVMGKGIALQFRRAYPEMFAAYQTACKAGEVQLGHMNVWETGSLTGPRYVINFPTKGHWKSGSKIEDIDAGLIDLVRVIEDLGISSIAIPPLGCGNGGLEWRDVEPRIRSALAPLSHVDVQLFAPSEAPSASTMPNALKQPPMTQGRAALVTLLDRYSRVATAIGATPIEVQKLMYFMQELGEPLRLRYTKHVYGPYADNLRHVLNAVEGHFLTGYGDGSSRVLDAEPIRVRPGAAEAAATVLVDHPDTGSRVDRVLEIIDGFESMYGMELLASVHWGATRDGAQSPERATDLVQSWTARKGRTFTDAHIRAAWDSLVRSDLILLS